MENHYTYRTEWSIEDNCFVARAMEFPLLSAFGVTRTEAESELDLVIEDVLKWIEEDGEPIPEPVTLKEYKGNILLRIPPATHRNIAVMALNEGVSANQYITSLIERNIYCDSISSFISKLENKLQTCNDIIQKMNFVNAEIYKRMDLLTENSFTGQEEQIKNGDRICPYLHSKDEEQLII